MFKKFLLASLLASFMVPVFAADEYKVSISAPFEPFEISDENGLLAGFDVDLIRAIAEDQGFEVVLFNDPWAEVLVRIDDGSRDISISGIAMLESRQEKYDFSIPYISNPRSALYINKALEINTADDLIELRVGAQSGSVNVENLNKLGVKEVVEYDSLFLAFRALARGKIDAITSSRVTLLELMNKHKEVPAVLKPLPYGDGRDSFGIVVQKGNQEILDKLNAGIQHLQENGKLQDITEKWIK